MSFDTWMTEYLEVISTFECLIPKEMDLIIILLLDIVQTEGLIPSFREYIEGYLTTDGVTQFQVRELHLHDRDHRTADVVRLVQACTYMYNDYTRRRYIMSSSCQCMIIVIV